MLGCLTTYITWKMHEALLLDLMIVGISTGAAVGAPGS